MRRRHQTATLHGGGRSTTAMSPPGESRSATTSMRQRRRPTAGRREADGRLRQVRQQKISICRLSSTEATGLEPATSGVTGRLWPSQDHVEKRKSTFAAIRRGRGRTPRRSSRPRHARPGRRCQSSGAPAPRRGPRRLASVVHEPVGRTAPAADAKNARPCVQIRDRQLV
jgi:hypothetical protein